MTRYVFNQNKQLCEGDKPTSSRSTFCRNFIKGQIFYGRIVGSTGAGSVVQFTSQGKTYRTHIGNRNSPVQVYRESTERPAAPKAPPKTYSTEEQQEMIDCAKSTGYPVCLLPFQKYQCKMAISRNMAEAFNNCLTAKSEVPTGEDEGRQARIIDVADWKKWVTPKNIVIGVLGVAVLVLGSQAIKKTRTA